MNSPLCVCIALADRLLHFKSMLNSPVCVGANPSRWLSEPPSSRSITTKVRGSWPDAMY